MLNPNMVRYTPHPAPANICLRIGRTESRKWLPLRQSPIVKELFAPYKLEPYGAEYDCMLVKRLMFMIVLF